MLLDSKTCWVTPFLSIIKWLKDSGLKVNDEKMELCLFYRNDFPPITISINLKLLTSKSTMNVLGVNFDSKLNWQNHVQTVIKNQEGPSGNTIDS